MEKGRKGEREESVRGGEREGGRGERGERGERERGRSNCLRRKGEVRERKKRKKTWQIQSLPEVMGLMALFWIAEGFSKP